MTDWKTRAEKAEAALRRLHDAMVEDRAATDMLDMAQEAVEDGEVVENMDEIADRNLNSMKELRDALADAKALISSFRVGAGPN